MYIHTYIHTCVIGTPAPASHRSLTMEALRQPCTRRDPQHDARSTARGGPSHRTTRGPERRADTRDTSTAQATELSLTHTSTDPVAPSCSHGDTSQLCGLGRRWWVQLRTILRSRPSLGSAQDHGGYTPLDAPPSLCVCRRARACNHTPAAVRGVHGSMGPRAKRAPPRTRGRTPRCQTVR